MFMGMYSTLRATLFYLLPTPGGLIYKMLAPDHLRQPKTESLPIISTLATDKALLLTLYK